MLLTYRLVFMPHKLPNGYGKHLTLQVQRIGFRETKDGRLRFKLVEVVEIIHKRDPKHELLGDYFPEIEKKYPGIIKYLNPGQQVRRDQLEQISGLKYPASLDWAKERSV